MAHTEEQKIKKLMRRKETLQTMATLTLLHSEQPKLHRVLAILGAKGLNKQDGTNNNRTHFSALAILGQTIHNL